MNNLFQKYWFTPYFPKIHLKIQTTSIREYLSKWVYQPLKRNLAYFYLKALRRFTNLKVIGITGSAGKTTTKEILYALLSEHGNTIISYKNIDPIYNIPTAILSCNAKTKYLILEMGIEYLGEMKFYKWLANPDYSIVTNIYPTHLKYLKNTKNVFKEKIQIIKDNIGILNNGSPYLKDIKPVNNKIIKFGQGSNCFASNIKLNLKGTSFVLHLDNATFKVQIPLYGRQMVDNFMAALFAAITIGINPISKLKNLRKLSSLDHRMKIINKHGLTIIDDSYNSNPEALIKAIKVLDEFPKHFKKVLVVGDMLDLGRDEVNYHKNIGKYICKLNLYALVGVGNLSKYMINQVSKKSFITSHTNSIFDAKMFINSLPAKNLLILIKGSRGIGLDELVTRL